MEKERPSNAAHTDVAVVSECVRTHANAHSPVTVMLDVLYVIGTLAFFGLMLAYVAGCERLGRPRDEVADSGETLLPRRRSTVRCR